MKSKARKQMEQQQKKYLDAATKQKLRDQQLKKELNQIPGQCRGCDST